MRTAVQRKAQHSRKDAILVLGMHRSGTSMLAGILDRIGCKGPNTKLEANDQNPRGYFESTPVFRLNDEIFAAAGTRWNDWQPMREGWLDSPRFNEFRSRAAEVVRAEYGGASMIYLKDPRICRLLPLWLGVLDEMGYRVSCIHTHRHPVDVATSLKARKNAEVEPSVGMLSWLRHNLEAEASSRDLPRIFTSYSSLIRDWQGFAHRAEETFGFVWPAMTRTARERVSQLVDPRLRHHEASTEAFLRDPLTPETFRETLRVLEHWSHNGENRDDRATLDRLRQDFDLSSPLLHAPVGALEAAARDIKSLTPHKAEVDALSANLAEAERKREQAGAREEQLKAELEKMRSAVDEAHSAARARQVDFDALSAKLAETEERGSKLVEEVTTWTNRLIERDKKNSELQRNADQYRADMEKSCAHAEELATKLAEAELEREQARAREEQLKAELEKMHEAVDEAHSAARVCQAWISQAFSVLDKQLCWWRVMPRRWMMDRQREQLRRLQLFDEQMYLEMYPDVAAAGTDPVRHYITHGMAEQRVCPR